MKNKDYSVLFGKTNAAKKLAGYLEQCTNKEQEKVCKIWNVFNKGFNQINELKFYKKHFKLLWVKDFETRISVSDISTLSKDLLLNIITAKYRQSLKEK